jgi:alkylated DNA repair dioxygenase AlkB
MESVMSMLFPATIETDDVPRIPGLALRTDFIGAEEEAQLVAAIDAEPWDTSWKRRRQFYGNSYGHDASPTQPIPGWAESLIVRLHSDGISDRPFDQILVNEYAPGQGISMHRDYQHFDRTVVSLSLAAPCVMDFHRPASGRRESLLLPRRSLLVLSDEARYEWQHGIAPRKSDRWQGIVVPRSRRLSVTFRLTRRDET